MWATLPCDLLIEIFCRLGSTTLIRCAGACRPWRRAIIDNASCLRRRPDRFLPDLLVGFFDAQGRLRQHRTLGWLDDDTLAVESVVDVSFYHEPITSRDGFVLLLRRRGWGSTLSNNLCLCNLLAGSCRFLPSTALEGSNGRRCSYVLVTGYDYNDGAGGLVLPVRIVAVVGEESRMKYQMFSSTSGGWGSVKRSAKLREDAAKVRVLTEPQHAVVCGGGSVVYWLIILVTAVGTQRRCVYAMDMRTERTWTTEVPNGCHISALVLAASEDGRRLSLVAWQSLVDRSQIDVWVLADDRRWTLQRTMDMHGWIRRNCPIMPGYIWLSGFCPRSGCLFGILTDHWGQRQQFIIGMDGSSPRLIQTVDSKSCYIHSYEMDWSTYISKMKYYF